MPTPRLTAAASTLRALIDPAAPVLDLYGEEGSDLYEAVTLTDTSELRELLTVVRGTSGEILELACGGGRLTLPLLSLGRAVTALDLSERMLEILTARAAELPPSRTARLTTARADMADYRIERSFGTVVLAATSIGLLDDDARLRALRCARRHLAPGGRLLITAPEGPGRAAGSATTSVTRSTAGETVILTDEVAADGLTRSVAALAARREDGRLTARVFVSEVRTVSGRMLRAEAAAVGLVSTGAYPVASRSNEELLIHEFGTA